WPPNAGLVADTAADVGTTYTSVVVPFRYSGSNVACTWEAAKSFSNWITIDSSARPGRNSRLPVVENPDTSTCSLVPGVSTLKAWLDRSTVPTMTLTSLSRNFDDVDHFLP